MVGRLDFVRKPVVKHEPQYKEPPEQRQRLCRYRPAQRRRTPDRALLRLSGGLEPLLGLWREAEVEFFGSGGGGHDGGVWRWRQTISRHSKYLDLRQTTSDLLTNDDWQKNSVCLRRRSLRGGWSLCYGSTWWENPNSHTRNFLEHLPSVLQRARQPQTNSTISLQILY